MFYFVWALGTFVIGLLSYNFGESYGRKFLALVVANTLDNTISDSTSSGHVYQNIKFITDQYL